MRNGWKLKKLGKIGECAIGLTYRPTDVCEAGGTLVLRSSNIRNGRIVYGDDDVFVSSPVPDSAKVRKGDILVCVRNGSRNLIGKCALIDDTADGHAFGAFMAVFRSADNDFVYQLFQSSEYRRQIRRNLGATINQITNKNLRELEFQFPPRAEQQRIAKILGVWDEAIEKTEKLIAAKEAQRNHLRRGLVSWSHWLTCPIGEVVSPVSRPEPTPKAAYKALGLRSHGKGTFQRIVERPEEIGMDTVYAVGARDLVVNITFAWEGAIALASQEDVGCLVSHRFPTFEVDEKKVNRSFLGYVVRSREFINDLGIASPGGAGRNRVLSKRDFLKIKIPFPPKHEQDQIAAVLGTADNEISLLKTELLAFNRQKRGLMQKLFAGERQGPLPDANINKVAQSGAAELAQ